MLPWETLRARDNRRTRRRTDLAALEQLEGRQLMAYSSLGYSLPDLQVSAQAGSVASWGSTYGITVILKNTGASTMDEPLSLVPATQVTIGPNGVDLCPRTTCRVRPMQRSARSASSWLRGLTRSPAPSRSAQPRHRTISQNDIERFNVSLTLPQKPAGFNASGVYYIRLVANQTNRCWSRTSRIT